MRGTLGATLDGIQAVGGFVDSLLGLAAAPETFGAGVLLRQRAALFASEKPDNGLGNLLEVTPENSTESE